MKKLKIFTKLVFIFVTISLIITMVYVYFFSPSHYRFASFDYVNSNITSSLNGFKIAYISDINLSDKKSLERLEKIVDELNEYSFDMALIGGDLFDGHVFSEKEVGNILKKIDCRYGKFAILGEKDQDSSLEIKKIFNDGGFEVLENTARTIHYNNDSFLLCACDKNYDISQFKETTKTIKVLMTHQPDSFTINQGKINLQLSGHSYGGTLYLPYFGALLKPQGAQNYNHGIYQENNSTLLVSNGLHASASFPYKLFAPNEVNLITLSKVEKK